MPVRPGLRSILLSSGVADPAFPSQRTQAPPLLFCPCFPPVRPFLQARSRHRSVLSSGAFGDWEDPWPSCTACPVTQGLYPGECWPQAACAGALRRRHSPRRTQLRCSDRRQLFRSGGKKQVKQPEGFVMEDSFGLIRVHSPRQALPHRVNGRLSSDMERRPPPLADSWCEQGGLRQQPAGFIRGRSEGC